VVTPLSPLTGTVAHHFTVDVEEYFHVSAMEPHIRVAEWDGMESRLEPSMDRLLGLLDAHNAKGTFFVLGWIARKYPHIVRAIADGGHEVASHGTMHQRVTMLTPRQFRDDIREARQLLEDLAGESVIGYRAPSFSITADRLWALDILVEEGYQYDSSLFPIRRAGYGLRNGLRDPYWISTAAGPLLEVPPTTLRRAGQTLPAAGGAYFRLFPLGIFRRAFQETGERGHPGTFYIHPWEIDPDQPRVAGIPLTTRIRHYGGLGRTFSRMERMFFEFRFTSIRENYGSVLTLSARPER
jgi:polysaccharide deacetylase family protein (PEP-CTERM system associated)